MKIQSEEICCPRFNPEPWHDKIHEWKNKNFIKGIVFSIFYVPINFGSVMEKFDEKLRLAGTKSKDGFCLTSVSSMWKKELFMATDVEIPNSENVKMTGKFYSRVYNGSFKETDNWIKEYKQEALKKGLQTRKPLFWYTTCPKCAKKYGENYVVIFSEVNQ